MPTLQAGGGNAPKPAFGGFLGLLCGLGPEMLQNGPLEASWGHFAGWGPKCPKRPSGSFLGPLCGLGPEMLQNDLLEASWGHFAGWGPKCFKMTLSRPPGTTLRGPSEVSRFCGHPIV